MRMRSPIARALAELALFARAQQCSGRSMPTASFFSDGGSTFSNPSSMCLMGRW